MTQRKLSLRKETLAELSSTELGQVVGASGVSCFWALCVTQGTECASDFQECITGLRCLSVTGC